MPPSEPFAIPGRCRCRQPGLSSFCGHESLMPQILGDPGDRCSAPAGELDGALPELRGVRCRHEDILPDGRSHLRSGVRKQGASS
jgi:hypothetical protein